MTPPLRAHFHITDVGRTARNWRYHTGLRLWLTKDPASQPQQINDTSEKGVYMIFDPNTWQRLKVNEQRLWELIHS